MALSSDLTFITNEPGNSLRDRFGKLEIHAHPGDVSLPSSGRQIECLDK
jgi:hypothetical protein